MELLVATWSVRLALLAALAVGGISISAGSPVLDAVERSIGVAFVFTLVGRQLIGLLETPQQRMLRLRARRNAKRAKSGKPDESAATGAPTTKSSRGSAARGGRSSATTRVA